MKAIDQNLCEESLIELSRGNIDALHYLYQETKSAIYALALSILKCHSDAEDTVSNTYIQVIKSIHTYQIQGKPLAWLFTICKNLAYQKIRDTKPVEQLEDYHFISNDNKEHETLNIILKTLDEENRQIVILHAIAGFKFRELSKLLDIPLSTVLSKYHRSIKQLKKVVKEEELWISKKN